MVGNSLPFPVAGVLGLGDPPAQILTIKKIN